MTGNYSKQFSKNKIYNILKKYYAGCEISYPQGSDSGTHPAILSVITYEDKNDARKNWEHYVFFYDFDVFFAGNNSVFIDKIMDNIRLDFLEEMVKDFKDTEYPKLLKNYYIEKLNRGESLKSKTTDLDSLNKEIKQAEYEKEYLENLM